MNKEARGRMQWLWSDWLSNRQFYQQEMKMARRAGLTIQPIPTSISNRNIIAPTAKAKRSASLKPILSCKAVPPSVTTTITDLPPIRSTIALPKTAQPPKERRQSSKLGFDGRILTREVKELRGGSREAGLSREALFQRKESHLNTYFNIRKNKLKEITHENKRIYVKINSQKSLYSSRQLNASIDSQHSRRLSASKLSNASRKSLASRSSKAERGRQGQEKKKEEVKIESLSINRVQSSQAHRYLNIFCSNAAMKQKGSTAGKPPEVLPPKDNKENSRHSRQMTVAGSGKATLSKLQLIVEELSQVPRRRGNLPLSRLL